MKFKHRKIIQLAKGYRGRGKNCFRTAVNRVHRAWRHRYASRRLFKRDTKRTWQVQINAGSRALDVPYSKLIHCLPLSGIILDRKILAELARTEPYSFKAVVETVKATGMKEWDEKRAAELAANHERNMAHREVQLGRSKAPYAFTDPVQADRLASIAKTTDAKRAAEAEDASAKARQAVSEIIGSDPAGEPWGPAFEQFERSVAENERGAPGQATPEDERV